MYMPHFMDMCIILRVRSLVEKLLRVMVKFLRMQVKFIRKFMEVEIELQLKLGQGHDWVLQSVEIFFVRP